ncbi:MAG: hypothetical protein AAFP02_04290, partial [Bacteroidota bacterium]
MQGLKKIGLGIFIAMLSLFTALVALSSFEVSDTSLDRLKSSLSNKVGLNDDHIATYVSVLEESKNDQQNKFPFVSTAKGAIKEANAQIAARYAVD